MSTKVTDNYELDFPARMADGRQFTDYRSNCILNNNISKQRSTWEYRDFLTKNAIQLQSTFVQDLEQKMKCNKCTDNTVLPVATVQNCNPEGCVMAVQNPQGLGTDRVNTFFQ